jgi:hypothetical protein
MTVLSDEELTAICQKAMREDPSSTLLVRGYATGMLQLQDAVKKILGDKWDNETRKAVSGRLYRLCLPGLWSADKIEQMEAENALGPAIAKVLREAIEPYCEHGRSISGTCLACDTMPGVGYLDED